MVLTTKCAYSAELLRHLKVKGVSIDAIVIEQSYRYALVKRLIKIKGVTETIRIIIERVVGMVLPGTTPSWRRNKFYSDYSEKVHLVNDLNGKQCEQILKESEPDIIALGYTRILRENIINIPRIGILNAHPGLLPKYRGINTVEWAIYNQDDIGATIHFVDKGVDTGPIVTQKAIKIERNDTIGSLRNKVETVSIELITETLLRMIQGEQVSAMPQLAAQGKQYYRMPRALLSQTEQRLKSTATTNIL